jgi:PAS domain S-box-containing protein
LTFVNPAYCAYFKRSPDQLLGCRFIDLVPQTQRAALLDHVQTVIARGTRVIVHEALRVDGTTAYQEWTDSPIFDATGRLLELQSIGRDVTTLGHVQREVEAQLAHVAHLGRVSLLGQLSGAFAHELRQPLTAILSNAQTAKRLLRKQPIDLEELGDILSDIEADDIRMGQVIAHMSALLKKRDAEVQAVTVDSIVRTALHLAQAKLAESRVSVRRALESDLPMVIADRVQVIQVFLNLVINAIDALSGNDPQDRILILSVARSGEHSVAFSVSDNGHGFDPPEAAAQVFDAFMTTKPDGLGLGLSICRTIIEAHHGTMSAGNNTPRGAAFTFTLPIAEPERPPDEESASDPRS